jgi:lysophospholipase L1-like esterase
MTPRNKNCKLAALKSFPSILSGLLFFSSAFVFLRAEDANPSPAVKTIIYDNTAVIPVPIEKAGWMKRHEWINSQARLGNINLIYVGDSIVQHFDKQGKEVWDRYYAPRHGLNMGISGDKTQHVLWRMDHGNLDGISPKLAIVMIGQNNGGHNTGREIADGVTAIVQRIRTKLPETKILLLGIFQRRQKPVPERADLAQANGIISLLADDKKIFYMDINPVFVRPDGTIPADLMPDYEHPSQLGHRLWAETIESKVSELMGDQPIPPASVVPSQAPPKEPSQ